MFFNDLLSKYAALTWNCIGYSDMTSMLSKATQEKPSVLLWLTRNRGVMGGLLTLNSFVTVFPDIDTTKSSSSTSSNATTQGMHLNGDFLFIHILIY